MNEVKHDILETLIVFPADEKGWRKELNLVSWNGKAPKYDLRSWNADHSNMGKGVTLSREELMILKEKSGGIKL